MGEIGEKEDVLPNKAEQTLVEQIDIDSIPSDAYSDFIAASPWRMFWLGLSIMLLVSILGPVVAIGTGAFAFGGASVGYESRATPIADKIITDDNIHRAECQGLLLGRPDGVQTFQFDYIYERSLENDESVFYVDVECVPGYEDTAKHKEEYDTQNGRRLAALPDGTNTSSSNPLFKFLPVSEGNKREIVNERMNSIALVFEGADLLSLNSLLGMCTAADQVELAYRKLGRCRSDPYHDSCALPRSLGNYAAALAGRATCSELTEADVSSFKSRLHECRPLYDSGALVGNCWDWDGSKGTDGAGTYTTAEKSDKQGCASTITQEQGERCARFNAVFDSFLTLLPTGYLSGLPSGVALPPLDEAQTVLADENMERPESIKLYKDTLQGMVGKTYSAAKLVAVDVDGIRAPLFFELLFLDIYQIFPIIFVLVYFFVWVHSGSFWIASMGYIQIFFAFAWGFLFYDGVIARDFFPFLNFLAIFLVIGIGADDIFVYIDAWKQSFTTLPVNTPLANRLSWTLSRAGAAITVTSLTTSVSFFANTISPVTAIKAFGLYTGLVVLADLALLVLFLPAVVAVYHTNFSEDAGRIQLANGKAGYGICSCDKPCAGIQSAEASDMAASTSVATKVGGSDDPSNDLSNATDETGNALKTPGDMVDTSPKESTGVSAFKYSVSSSTAGNGSNETVLEGALPGGTCINCCCCIVTGIWDPCAIPPLELVEDENGAQSMKQPMRWAETLLQGPVSDVLLHPWGRFIFVGACAGITAWLIGAAMRLSRPSSSYLQLMSSSHPLELYDGEYVNHFDIGPGDTGFFPYKYSWGIKAIDNGDPFDPHRRGRLVYTELDISSPDSQQWLFDFCVGLSQDSVALTGSAEDVLQTCGMYNLNRWMQGNCNATTSWAQRKDAGEQWAPAASPKRSTCCGYSNTSFPFSQQTFSSCLIEFTKEYGDGSKIGFQGFFFDKAGALKVITVSGTSTVRYTEVFEETSTFLKNGEDILTGDTFNVAPPPPGSGLDGGFFVSRLRWYGLQEVTLPVLCAIDNGYSLFLAFSSLH
jgi:hypothetical protein